MDTVAAPLSAAAQPHGRLSVRPPAKAARWAWGILALLVATGCTADTPDYKNHVGVDHVEVEGISITVTPNTQKKYSVRTGGDLDGPEIISGAATIAIRDGHLFVFTSDYGEISEGDKVEIDASKRIVKINGSVARPL